MAFSQRAHPNRLWPRLIAVLVPLAMLLSAWPNHMPADAASQPGVVRPLAQTLAQQAPPEPTPQAATLPAASSPISAPTGYAVLHNCSPSSAWSRFGGYGVNAICGNFITQMVDLSIAGRGMPVAFARTYNSADPTVGTLGLGWTHSYNLALTIESASSIVARMVDGRQDRYTNTGSGFVAPAGIFNTLTAHGDGSFSLRLPSQIVYQFDASGRLTSIADRNANTIALNYTAGRLATITDTVGRVVTLTYDGSGRLIQLTDPLTPTARVVTYAYDGAGRLQRVTDPRGNPTNFSYDTAGRLITITDPRPQLVLINSYDAASGRVIEQRDAANGTVGYAYDYNLGQTSVSDQRGNPSVVSFDAQYRAAGERDAGQFVALFEYDAQNNLIGAVDKRGYRTALSYDVRGNLTSLTDPYNRVTLATYDAQNNPLTLTDALNHVTRLEYTPAGIWHKPAGATQQLWGECSQRSNLCDWWYLKWS